MVGEISWYFVQNYLSYWEISNLLTRTKNFKCGLSISKIDYFVRRINVHMVKLCQFVNNNNAFPVRKKHLALFHDFVFYRPESNFMKLVCKIDKKVVCILNRPVSEGISVHIVWYQCWCIFLVDNYLPFTNWDAKTEMGAVNIP